MKITVNKNLFKKAIKDVLKILKVKDKSFITTYDTMLKIDEKSMSLLSFTKHRTVNSNIPFIDSQDIVTEKYIITYNQLSNLKMHLNNTKDTNVIEIEVDECNFKIYDSFQLRFMLAKEHKEVDTFNQMLTNHSSFCKNEQIQDITLNKNELRKAIKKLSNKSILIRSNNDSLMLEDIPINIENKYL